MNVQALRAKASRLLQEATVNQLAGYVELSKNLMVERAEVMKAAELQEWADANADELNNSNEPDWLEDAQQDRYCA